MRGLMAAAGVLGALGVILGAFGAHALQESLSERNREIYETATFYHLVHVLPMLLAPTLLGVTRWAKVTVILFLVGILIFSGSLYVLAVTDLRWLGAITPIGGTAMIAGWLALAIGAARGAPSSS